MTQELKFIGGKLEFIMERDLMPVSSIFAPIVLWDCVINFRASVQELVTKYLKVKISSCKMQCLVLA